MAELGLPKGALLVVDRSQKPVPNSFVLLRHEEQFLCRLMVNLEGKPVFTNGKETFYPTPNETEIIGVITSSIKPMIMHIDGNSFYTACERVFRPDRIKAP